MVVMRTPELLRALAAVAPGQPLREGLDRILQAGKGAIVVVGDDADVLNICSGGFQLDAGFSPQRLSELAKMDGAIIVAPDASRIARANVHLMPDPNVATSETGTRHRTAERVARSLGVPVIAVSQGQRVISVYADDQKYPLPQTAFVLDRANQGLQTLQRYRARLDRDSAALTTLEIEDVVSLQDAIDLLQLAETMLRIAAEVEADIVELGSEGRLITLQLAELIENVGDQRRWLVRDYFHDDADTYLDDGVTGLSRLTVEELTDDMTVASVLRFPPGASDLNSPVTPRGYRLMAAIPRLPPSRVDEVVRAFGSLPKIMRATEDDLVSIGSLSPELAKMAKDGIRRVAEASILRQV